MHRLPLAVLLLLSACTGRESDETLGGWLYSGPAERVVVQRSIGPAPHAAIARAVNSFGVAVPGAEPLDVQVNSTTQALTFDTWGYGQVVVSEPGLHEVQMSTGSASVYATDAPLELFHLLPGNEALGTATEVVGVTGGVLAAVGSDVWFVPPSGDAHRVISFPERYGAVQGLRAAHIDRDDELDAIVWADNTLIILRGRPGGGMVWGGGIESSDLSLSIADAVIADVSNDREADIVVAWASQHADHQVQVWEGNGLFAFEDWPTVRVRGLPGALTVGDNAGDGRAHLTVLLVGEDNWQRWSVLDRELLAVGPAVTRLGMPQGSSLWSGVDYNGDGADELLVVGPLVPGMPRVVKMYNLADTSDDTIKFIEESYSGAHFAAADGDGDGIADLFALEQDGRLMSLSWTGDGYSQRKVADLAQGGPLDFADVTGDGTPDLFVAGETYSWWTGTTEQGAEWLWWAVDSPALGSWPLERRGPVVAVDLDDDLLSTEFVSVVGSAGRSYAQLWKVEAGQPPTAKAAGQVELSAEGAFGLDIAICGTAGYFLTETNLSRVDLSSLTRTAVVPSEGSRVACGEGPAGSQVAVLVGDEVRLLDSNLTELAVEQHAGAVDLALLNLAGVPSVGVCDQPGCAVEAWSMGDRDVLLVGTPTELWAEDGQGIEPLSGRGIPSVADVNGDGFEDALAVWPHGDGTAIGIYLSAEGRFGPARVMHTTPAGQGPAIVGDVTGDSLLNVLFGDVGSGIFTSL